jgi:hypothetical protein
MSPPSREYPSRPPILVDGRVLAPSTYRPSTFVDLEDTPEWWSSLALLGALLATAGVVVFEGAGDAAAVGGVGLFFATAILAGLERTELATATGASGVAWCAAGISVALVGTPAPGNSALGLGLVGAGALIAGIWGAVRARGQETGRG